MDAPLLIDAIVRQTTVLIAQLATTSGSRAPLAKTANQVFLSLVHELKRQGVSSKVIADMFGLALRTYHNRVRQLSESNTFRGQSLWEAVLSWVREQGPVLRAQVLRRFSGDEEALVRAVLSDLVDNQLLLRTGKSDATTYRAATDADRVEQSGVEPLERLAMLVWVAIHRYGPVSAEGLAQFVSAEPEPLGAALKLLLDDERVQVTEVNGTSVYSSDNYLIPVGQAAGWEAAVFDHYQALVTALCTKLRQGQLNSQERDWVGGSTYCYDVWPEHPLQAEVAGFLKMVRERAVDLRLRVEEFNTTNAKPTDSVTQRFVSYVGQTVISERVGEVE